MYVHLSLALSRPISLNRDIYEIPSVLYTNTKHEKHPPKHTYTHTHTHIHNIPTTMHTHTYQHTHAQHVSNGVHLPEQLEWVKFSSIAWTHDDNGFFYARYPKPETFMKGLCVYVCVRLGLVYFSCMCVCVCVCLYVCVHSNFQCMRVLCCIVCFCLIFIIDSI